MNRLPNGIITLSRRNLQTLLKMLDLRVGQPILRRGLDDGSVLVIKAEEDEVHYQAPERGTSQGKMGDGPDDIQLPFGRLRGEALGKDLE